MAIYEQLPGQLSLSIVSGDEFSSVVDFDIDLTSYTVEAWIKSTVTNDYVLEITTAFVNASVGTINLSLTEIQTASLSIGTYTWVLLWTAPGTVERTALSGIFEVRA